MGKCEACRAGPRLQPGRRGCRPRLQRVCLHWRYPSTAVPSPRRANGAWRTTDRTPCGDCSEAWNLRYASYGWRDNLTGLPLDFGAGFFNPRRASLAAHRRHHTHRVWGAGNDRNVRVEAWYSNLLLKTWRYSTLTATGASASATADEFLRSLLITRGSGPDKRRRRGLIVALWLDKSDPFEIQPEVRDKFKLNGAETYEHQLLGLAHRIALRLLRRARVARRGIPAEQARVLRRRGDLEEPQVSRGRRRDCTKEDLNLLEWLPGDSRSWPETHGYKDVSPGEADRDKSVLHCARRFDWASDATMVDCVKFARVKCQQGSPRA